MHVSLATIDLIPFIFLGLTVVFSFIGTPYRRCKLVVSPQRKTAGHAW